MSSRYPFLKLSILLGVAAVITLLMGVVAFRVPSEADQPVSADVKLDGFRYIVGQDDVGSYFVTVFFDDSSVAGLKAYAMESRRQTDILLQQGIDTLYVEATFNSPLSLDEFAELVVQSGMEVDYYNMRAIDAQGDRVGMQGGPSEDELVQAWLLDEMLRGIERNSGGKAEFKGFISVAGMVNRQGYQKLVAHPKVFLVDVSVNLARQVLQTRGRPVNLREIQLVVGPVYWGMENLGLQSFQ